MSDQISTCAQFDYGQYAPGVAHELRKAAKRLRAARAAEWLQTLGARRPMDNRRTIAKIGNALAAVKEKIGPENWASWLEGEAKLSVLCADFFMAGAELFSLPAPLRRRLVQEYLDKAQGFRSE
jgi:hypothetical protein